jgi:curli biogenesis system outer membrane secretion channel CsgG
MVRVSVCAGLLAATALGGCSNLAPDLAPYHQNVVPVTGPPPRLNTTPMEPALACLRRYVRSSRGDLRIGVNDFIDGTGVMEGGTQYSHALSQRPDMMMVVALAGAGAHLVNRSSVNVAEWELKQAMDKKLGDGRKEKIAGETVTFRPVRTGVILGSTDYVSGAITELNWNISSGVAEAGAYGAGIGKRVYRISIAVDLMVTNTQTTEIVYAKSFKKQLVGYEINANFFRFFNQNTALQAVTLGSASASTVTQALELFDANLGEKQNEPTQVALRWVIDLAAYDIMRKLTHAGQSCDILLPRENIDDDVLKPPKPAVPSAQGGALPVKSGAADVAKVAAAKSEPPAAPAPESVSLAPADSGGPNGQAEAAAAKQADAAASNASASAEPHAQSGGVGQWISNAARAIGLSSSPKPDGEAVQPDAQVASTANTARAAADAAVPATEDRAVMARAEQAAPDEVEVKPAAATAIAGEPKTPPVAAIPASTAGEPAAAAKPAPAKSSSASEKRPKARPKLAEKKPHDSKPDGNTQAKSDADGSGIHWMTGSVRALGPGWSRSSEAGDVK